MFDMLNCEKVLKYGPFMHRMAKMTKIRCTKKVIEKKQFSSFCTIIALYPLIDVFWRHDNKSSLLISIIMIEATSSLNKIGLDRV